jgi:hypothetical protein
MGGRYGQVDDEFDLRIREKLGNGACVVDSVLRCLSLSPAGIEIGDGQYVEKWKSLRVLEVDPADVPAAD